MTIKLHTKDKTIVVDWPTVPEKGDRVEIDGKTYWTTYTSWYIYDSNTPTPYSYVEVGLKQL